MKLTETQCSVWLLAIVLVASCSATQIEVPAALGPTTRPGFWMGLWHGVIAPIAFIVSLFSEHVRIYTAPNAGRWYDFGFMLGISGFSGGIFAGSRTRAAKPRSGERATA